MTKILLVEDDDTIAFGIRAALEKRGYEIKCCPSVRLAKEQPVRDFHLVLLDLNLSDGSGYDFCSWVKKQCDIPIIFLTVCDGVTEITKGLNMGADDYITKPFHISVLESRIAAVLRRVSKSAVDMGRILTCQEISLNKDKMTVSLNGIEIGATALEYRLLLVLMENAGRTLPRNMILDKLWDSEGNFVNDNTLTVTMKRLREKLGNPSCIVTVRGIGYRMEKL